MEALLPDIEVCICTYKRPALLRRLLGDLRYLETDNRFTYSIIVGDNDAAESARPVVEEFQESSSTTVRYCVEPIRNIARARNKVLAESAAEYVALIDDDEFPSPGWLRLLWATCQLYEADGVLGPVLPDFGSDVPAWFQNAGFYDFRRRFPTGERLPWFECRTGNALLRTEVFRSSLGPFKEEFGTGGEDQDFFQRAIAQGRQFVWCDEAVVHETIAPSRWRRRNILSRALLRGKNNLSRSQDRSRNILKAIVAVPLYLVLLPFAFFGGQRQVMKLANRLTSHLGLLLACVHLNPVQHRQM